MKIVMGSDHSGKELRQELVKYLESKNHEILDCGNDSDRSNYVTEAIKVSENLMIKNYDLGIIICGTGIGVSITANKIKGIRAALIHNVETAKLARLHNNANVITIGARFNNISESKAMIDAFLSAEFEGGRHKQRIDSLKDYEDSCIDC